MSKKITSTHYLFVLGVIVIVALVSFAVMKKATPSVYDSFAQCLTESGAVEYGAWWCPNCENQKKRFGNSFQYVDYIECSNANRSMNQTCSDAGIEGYPTWQFGDGSRLAGDTPLSVLAERSGCELPKSL